MRDCDAIRTRLLDLVEGELAAGEQGDIEVHLTRCPHCEREARELRETLACLRSLPEPAVPDGLLEDFAAAVQQRIADETPLRLPFWRRMTTWLRDVPSLRPVPALSAAAVLGLLLAIGLVWAPRTPQTAPVPEVLVVGESLSIAQNLDVLEQLDLLEELDVLEKLPLLGTPENGRPLTLS